MEQKTISQLELERDTFIALLSARKTGKSVLMADLMHYFLTAEPGNRVDFLYLFSETAGLQSGTNEQYKFLDQKCVIPADPTTMTRFINGVFESQRRSNFK